MSGSKTSRNPFAKINEGSKKEVDAVEEVIAELDEK
jgi:hypothetical protein